MCFIEKIGDILCLTLVIDMSLKKCGSIKAAKPFRCSVWCSWRPVAHFREVEKCIVYLPVRKFRRGEQSFVRELLQVPHDYRCLMTSFLDLLCDGDKTLSEIC